MVRDSARVDSHFPRCSGLRDLRLKGRGRLSGRPLSFWRVLAVHNDGARLRHPNDVSDPASRFQFDLPYLISCRECPNETTPALVGRLGSSGLGRNAFPGGTNAENGNSQSRKSFQFLIHICECPNWDSTKGLCPYSEPGVQFRVTSVLVCRSVA